MLSKSFPVLTISNEIEDDIVEPYSDEGQEVIHDGSGHVLEIWEDGEITSTKSGDLYGRRSVHRSVPPLLPENKELFDTGDSDHKRMVITDRRVKELMKELHEATHDAQMEVLEE